MLFSVLSIADVCLIFILPPLPAGGGVATLEYIASNTVGYILFQTLVVGPVVLMLILA